MVPYHYYYRNTVLSQMLLQKTRCFSDECYECQLIVLVRRLAGQRPEFIAPLLWLQNSPDLNPVDYIIWRILQKKM